jgi:N-acetylmuramoyl-L-alanine amidase
MLRVATVVAIVAILLLGFTAPAEARTGVVTGSIVNLRAGPGTQHPIVGQLQQGTRVEVLEVSGDWVHVRTAAGQVGWMAGWLLEIEQPPAPTVVRVTGQNVNIRSGPGTGHGVIGRTGRPEAFALAGRQGEWLRVTLPSGQPGWISAGLAQLVPINTAMFSTPALNRQGTVLGQAAVRRMPSTRAPEVATLQRGTTVAVVTSSGTWHQVRLPDGDPGWVEGQHLTVHNVGPGRPAVEYSFSADRLEIRQHIQAVVARPDVNLRGGPSTGHPVVTLMRQGLPLRVTGARGEWLQVVTGEGHQGWVAGRLTTTVSRPRLNLVSLESANPQQKTLSVRGSLDTLPLPFWLEDGRTLVVWTGVPSHEAEAGIHENGAMGLTVNAQGIMIRFSVRPQYRVIESSLAGMTMAFSSAVTGLELVALPDREILRFSTRGNALPLATYDAASGLQVVFPNVTYTGPPTLAATELVRSTTLDARDGGLTVRVDSAALHRYTVRAHPDRIDVELLRPGLAGRVIVVDAGHGGRDPGAIGPTGLQEAPVCLQLALLLKPMLQAEGAIVHLTRTTEAAVIPPPGFIPTGFDPLVGATHDLRARSAWAHVTRADVLLSIHMNGNLDPAIDGTMTLYHPGLLSSDASLQLARHIHQSTLQLGRPDRNIRAAELTLLFPLTQPAVISEIVHITNPREEALLRDPAFLQAAAQALFNGLRSYFGP